ncbi:guanylate kinase [Brackiella oedipodis]|uniref:guanylate kinase n=1 Tax=Brackiella oedipodis TaxID=124225 RepID=UPI0004915F2E|nr:guanylate kinase [Brackiella oedipodis]
MSKTPGNIFMVVAPSGAGKSSLVNALLQQDKNIGLSISCTTRAPRQGEVHGKHYFFVSEDQFKSMQANGELLESAHVHGNYYGTPKQYVEQQLAAGHDILLEIDWQGAAQVRQQFSDLIDIFILPPSLEALKERLQNRGQDSADVIERRINGAATEIKHALDCEYVIINNDFNAALQQLQQIVNTARLRGATQAKLHAELFASLGVLTH